MDKRLVNMPGFENLYYIYDNGDVYSIRKDRYLKPQLNSYGYVFYALTQEKTEDNKYHKRTKLFSSHRLVMIAFKGYPEDKKKIEVHHIDHNRTNNDINNLAWVTHSENLLLSFKEHGRESYWKGKNKPSPSLETRIKMSNAKFKPVACYNRLTEEYKEHESVEALCEEEGIHRRTFNRILKNPNHKCYSFKFIKSVSYS